MNTEDLLDSRDLAVLDELIDGQIVSRGDLELLYRAATDIRQPRTLDRRIRELVDVKHFELIQHGRWRYHDDSGDKGESTP